ncbi:MAG: hypothetical protein EA398_15170, partial [Deltaproteobacteria bacterium]
LELTTADGVTKKTGEWLVKVNTSKTGQLSLFNQGVRWLELQPGAREAWNVPLVDAFLTITHAHDLGQLMLEHLAQEK